MRLSRKTDLDRRLAPLDPLGREIQAVLDLIKPVRSESDDEAQYEGYCGAASEAYLHLSGGRDSGLAVRRCARRDGTSHWWLERPFDSGKVVEVIDLTLGPADRRHLKEWPEDLYPYDRGRGAMFQNGYARPSKRAAAIIELVLSRRLRG